MKKTLLLLITFAFTYVSSAQTVVTFAGKANDDAYNKYESGSGVALNNTFFSLPEGLCFDPNGKMYISEKSKIRAVINNKLYIRTGSLQSPTFAEGYKNGTGTQAKFRNPGGMVSNSNGDIFVADIDNHCIRKVNAYTAIGTGQSVSTFAGANPTPGLPGNGTSGSSNGTGSAAKFNRPMDITMDADGNFYVTDSENYTIRKISPTGVVTTLAGTAGSEGTTDGTGSAARFSTPWGVAMYNSNTIVVTDAWNTNIRKINIYTGVTTTLTGSTTGPDPRQVDGTLSSARFKSPKGITVVDGIIYVTDQNIVRAIDEANNSVTTFAGNKSSFSITDGVGSAAAFTEMSDIQADGLGNLFVTENSSAVASSVIRKITIDNLAPIADFEATKTNIITNEEVTLTNKSRGQAATAINWIISPVDYTIKNGTLTSKNIDLSFNSAGFYTVKLSITNSYGTDAKTVENFFVVSTTGSISRRYSSSNLMTVYPNPANNSITLDWNQSLQIESSNVSLFNINGMKIMEIDPLQAINTT
ncbi:hypothetical protein OAD66_09735, partial [Bacteroidia bacterium]|nr:hypothetical protein [Bacteroidia bacterium]